MKKSPVKVPYCVAEAWLREWEESAGDYSSKYVGRASETLADALVEADERMLAIREELNDE